MLGSFLVGSESHGTDWMNALFEFSTPPRTGSPPRRHEIVDGFSKVFTRRLIIPLCGNNRRDHALQCDIIKSQDQSNIVFAPVSVRKHGSTASKSSKVPCPLLGNVSLEAEEEFPQSHDSVGSAGNTEWNGANGDPRAEEAAMAAYASLNFGTLEHRAFQGGASNMQTRPYYQGTLLGTRLLLAWNKVAGYVENIAEGLSHRPPCGNLLRHSPWSRYWRRNTGYLNTQAHRRNSLGGGET